MYVLQYEQQPEAPPRDPVRQEVASVNTHDMPPFAAFWKGLDIADRQDLGLIANRELPAQKKTRARMRQALIAALRKEKLLSGKTADVRAVLEGVLRFLARSDAETVLLNLEDLWGETRSQNVPGTSTERPNWRRKSRLSLEEIRTSARIAAILRRIQMER
jgi:4-alpha-glucanotransferase